MITERERQREYCESCTSYVTKHDKEEIEVYNADEDFFFSRSKSRPSSGPNMFRSEPADILLTT